MKKALLFLLLAACGNKGMISQSQGLPHLYLNFGPDLSGMQVQTSSFSNQGSESTPIVFGGALYVIRFGVQDQISYKPAMTVLDSNANVVSSLQADLHYGCAINVNGTVYAFATNSLGTETLMFSSTDLINWTQPIVVRTAEASQTLYNTSVSQSPNGFVMAYEVQEEINGKPTNFTFHTALSSDLINWTDDTPVYDAINESACPTIRYSNGNFYVYYLVTAQSGSFTGSYTVEAKSSDRINWTVSLTPIVTPDEQDGTNASDFDFTEYNGQIVFVYLGGDQMIYPGYAQNSLRLRMGTYQGSVDQFLNAAFN